MTVFVRERLDRVVLRGFLTLGLLGGLFSSLMGPIRAARDEMLFWTGSVGYATGFPEDEQVRPQNGASFTWDGDLDVRLDEPDTGLKLLAALPDSLAALAIAVVCMLLLLVVLDTHHGHPFLSHNAQRLRAVAFVIFIAAVLIPLAHAWANQEIMTTAVQPEGREFSGLFDFQLGTTVQWSLVGLFVLSIAEVFRIGGRLADDVEGLV
jgi:hypothetical protein